MQQQKKKKTNKLTRVMVVSTIDLPISNIPLGDTALHPFCELVAEQSQYRKHLF